MWGKRVAVLVISLSLTGFTVSTAQAATGVVPASTSWTSADRGWVLGVDPLCPVANCPQLVRTFDGGATWAKVKTPALTVPDGGDMRLRVVFANEAAGMVTDGEQLFVTSNGGTRWEPSGVKGVVGALGFDDHGFLAVIYDGETSRLFQRSLWFGQWRPVPGVEVKGRAFGDIAPGHVSLSLVFQENRYWTRSPVGWAEEPAPCTVESATRLGTVGTTRYALCGFDPGFGNMTKQLRESVGGPFKTVSVPPREGITLGFAISPEAALVSASGRDWSYIHRGSGERWSSPLVLGGPRLWDLAFADAKTATVVRGGPGSEFAEVYKTDDAGTNWQLVKV